MNRRLLILILTAISYAVVIIALCVRMDRISSQRDEAQDLARKSLKTAEDAVETVKALRAELDECVSIANRAIEYLYTLPLDDIRRVREEQQVAP